MYLPNADQQGTDGLGDQLECLIWVVMKKTAWQCMRKTLPPHSLYQIDVTALTMRLAGLGTCGDSVIRPHQQDHRRLSVPRVK